MKKEISEALMDFYQRMLMPEFEEIKRTQAEHGTKFIDVLGHLDSIYKRFDRLEDEYQMIIAALKRLEEQMEGDSKNRKELTEKVRELKNQFQRISKRLEDLEKELAGP